MAKRVLDNKMTKDLAAELSKGQVHVLRAGEERNLGNNEFYAPCTITLIRHGYEKGVKAGVCSIVDPGVSGDERIVSEELRKLGVFPGQIENVFITHNHPDHYGALSCYNNARVYTPDSSFVAGSVMNRNKFKLWVPDGFYDEPGNRFEVFPGLTLVSAPGHSGQDYVVVHESEDCMTLVAGDLFWDEEDYNRDTKFKELCFNPKLQEQSRGYICGRDGILHPDVIIPGHGPAFVPS